jgi:hypothetical protein
MTNNLPLSSLGTASPTGDSSPETTSVQATSFGSGKLDSRDCETGLWTVDVAGGLARVDGWDGAAVGFGTTIAVKVGAAVGKAAGEVGAAGEGAATQAVSSHTGNSIHRIIGIIVKFTTN